MASINVEKREAEPKPPPPAEYVLTIRMNEKEALALYALVGNLAVPWTAALNPITHGIWHHLDKALPDGVIDEAEAKQEAIKDVRLYNNKRYV